MKKLILTEGTEFEQNGKDLAIIDTDQRGGKPIMLDSSDLDASIINGETQALDKISVDVSNEPQVEVVATTEDQTITPGEEYTGLSSVVVKGVTSDVDSDIQPENIIRGVNILGTEGTAKVTAYVLVDSNNYNTDANKATVLQIKQDIADGKEPLVYLYSRYENQGWNVTPCHYYLCCIPYNTDNGITFRTLIPYKESNQPVTMNGVSYNHIAMLTVWFNISNGVVTGTDNNLQRIPYPTLSYADNSPIGMTNTSAYTPSGDYNPATKKYVDDSIGAIQLPDITPYETYSSNIGRFPVFNWQPNIVMSGNGSSLGSSDLNLLRGYIQDMYNKGKPDFAIYCALKDDNGSGNYYVPHRFLLLQRHTKAIYAKPTSMQFVGFSVYDQAFNTAMAHTLLSLTLSWSGDTVTVSSGYITAYRRDYAIKSDLSNYLAKNNSTEFTPTGDYQPATKKYVDGLAGGSPKNIFEIEYDFSMMGTPQWYSTTDTLGVAYIEKINEVYKKGIDNFIIRIIKPDRSFYLDIIININRTNHTVSDTGINKGHWDSSGAGYVDKYFAIGTNYGNGFEYDSTNDAFTHESGSILAVWISEPDLARKADVLTKSNTTSYTPTADYHPATKKYVDDNAGGGGSYLFDLRKYYPTNNWGYPEVPTNQCTTININNNTDLTNMAQLLTDIKAGKVPAVFFKCYAYLDGNSGMNQQKELITPAAIMPYGSTTTSTSDYSQCSCFAIIPVGATTESIYPTVPTGLYVRLDLERKKLQLSLYTSNTLATQGYVDSATVTRNNTSSYTPTGDYNPATKKYVDDAVAGAGGVTQADLLKRGIYVRCDTQLNNTDTASLSNAAIAELQAGLQAAYDAGLSTVDITLAFKTNNSNTLGYMSYQVYNLRLHSGIHLIGKPTSLHYSEFNSNTTTFADAAPIKKFQLVISATWSGNTITVTRAEYRLIQKTIMFLDNTYNYTPTENYHPASKKYVDDSVSAITVPALTLSNTSFDLGYDIEGETIEDDDITAIHTFAQTVELASGGNKQIILNVTDTNSTSRQFQAIMHRNTTTASNVTTDVITVNCFDLAGNLFTLYTSKTSESGQEDILFGEYDSLGLVDFPTLTRFLTEISGYDDSKTQVLKNISGTFTWVDE